MRVKHNDCPIPKRFMLHPGGENIRHELDIWVTGGARIKLKVLIFKKPKDLCMFWKKTLGRDLGGSQRKGYETQGCVSALMNDVESYADPKKVRKWSEVDPNYFAVMGLCLDFLTPEVLIHECVHAAYAYEKRRKGMFWIDKDEIDEEHIAYPTGRIAKVLMRRLAEKNLLN